MTLYVPNSHRQTHKNTFLKKGHPGHSQEEQFVRLVKKTIQEQIGNPQLDVTVLANLIHLSVSQLNRKLNAILHCPAGSLIREMRMQYAAQFLRSDAGSIGEIAFKVGYQNQANFCRCFKQQFGCTPSSYSRRRK